MNSLKRPQTIHHAQLLPAALQGSINQAAELARAGYLIVIPTDTLYGLACDAFNPAAIQAIYAAKQRSQSKSLPILLADSIDLLRVVRAVPPAAQPFIEQFWPGSLTILLPKHPRLPIAISNNDNVAVRIPDNEVARAIIRAAGGAMAVTSANLSGEAPATTAVAALDYLQGLVTAVVDDGPSSKAVASTILDCTGNQLKILREGAIPSHQLLGQAKR